MKRKTWIIDICKHNGLPSEWFSQVLCEMIQSLAIKNQWTESKAWWILFHLILCLPVPQSENYHKTRSLSLLTNQHLSHQNNVITNEVWKFQDFSVNQILREINFGESRSSKTSIFTIFCTVNFIDLVILAFKIFQS